MQPVTEMKIMIVMSISSLFCYECMYMCIYISRLNWFNFEMYMSAKLTRVGLLMVNFICQFDWATGYLDICSNIILGVSVRAFSDEMNIWINRLNKADCPPLCRWASFNQLKAWIKQSLALPWVREYSYLTANVSGPHPVIWISAAAAAKLLQSCLTLCDPRDGSPPGSPIPGILQARTLEWVAISFSNAWKWKVKVKSFSRVWPLVTPWTAAYQAPLSMGVSRQDYWSGVLLPSPIWISK